jgi:hypothetical protein
MLIHLGVVKDVLGIVPIVVVGVVTTATSKLLVLHCSVDLFPKGRIHDAELRLGGQSSVQTNILVPTIQCLLPFCLTNAVLMLQLLLELRRVFILCELVVVCFVIVIVGDTGYETFAGL